MKKYKVNIDREKPSSEEILSRRNFDELMKQYNAAPAKPVQKPLWKKGWFVGSLVSVLIAVSAVIVVMETSKTSVKNGAVPPSPIVQNVNTRNAGSPDANATALTVQKRTITPPIKGLDVIFSKFSINASKGGTVTYRTGSKLIFPENAFVDANGVRVTGDVEIRYREFRDPVDVFLAGIPMQYDSAGKTFEFESAGMLEVNAFMKGQHVFLDKNKTVEIRYASENSDSKFSVYLFDTTAGNWSFRGKDRVEKQDQNNDGLTPAQRAKKEKEDRDKVTQLQKKRDDAIAEAYRQNAVPAQPKMPIKADKHKPHFVLDCDPKEFPEILAYKEVIWIVDESKENFDPNTYKITWDDMKIVRGKEEGKYILSLKKGATKLDLDVYPSYDGEGLTNASKEYDKLYESYSQALAKRTKAEQTARSNYENALNSAGLNEAMLASQHKTDAASQAVTDNVLRVFSISSFGIYNCDAAGSYPDGVQTTITLKDDKGNVLQGMTSLYHVDRKKFGLYLYAGNPIASFSFDPNSPNLMWGVKDGVLYTADDDQFRNVRGQQHSSFLMKPVPQSFTSPDAMRSYFGIHAKH